MLTSFSVSYIFNTPSLIMSQNQQPPTNSYSQDCENRHYQFRASIEFFKFQTEFTNLTYKVSEFNHPLQRLLALMTIIHCLFLKLAYTLVLCFYVRVTKHDQASQEREFFFLEAVAASKPSTVLPVC